MRKIFELAIPLDGEEEIFQLTPSFHAISLIEGHQYFRTSNDGSLTEILSRIARNRPRVTDIVAVVHGAILATGRNDVSAEQVGEALSEKGVLNHTLFVSEFIAEALGVTDDDLQNSNRRQRRATAKKKRSTAKKKRTAGKSTR